MSSRYPPRPFTALTECPTCGTITVHPWHLPPEDDPDMDTEGDREADTADLVAWGGAVIQVVETNIRYRADRTTCDVIRECTRCGATWPEH